MNKYLFSLSVICAVFIANSTLAQKKGSLMDVRDGQVYKTIEIGNQIWMAQNLNYSARGSWCYENEDENCKQYGLIYTWTAIMNGEDSEKAKGICPEGWHIPTNDEWEILSKEYKKSKDLATGGISGFEMQYAGCRFPNATFDFQNQVATFWTSSKDEFNPEFVYTRYAYEDKKNAPMASYSTNREYGQYLRCIKD